MSNYERFFGSVADAGEFLDAIADACGVYAPGGGSWEDWLAEADDYGDE